MRCLYRVVQLTKDKIVGFSKELGNVLKGFIDDIAKDEKDLSPNYVYLLFETTALSLKFLNGKEEMKAMKSDLMPSLNFIIQNNKSDLMGYAFQIYSLYVSSTDELKPLFSALVENILKNKEMWSDSHKHLVPSMTQFLISMICKHPEHMKQYSSIIGEVVKHLLDTKVRMETSALQIISAFFERVGIVDQTLHDVLFAIFQTMHYYRNNTKKGMIPPAITRTVFIFFATFIINFGEDSLI